MLILWTTQDRLRCKAEISKLGLGDVPYRFAPVQDKLPLLSVGDTLLAQGSVCHKILQDQGLVPKNRTINSLREDPILYQGGSILLTYDIGVKEYDYTSFVKWGTDVRLAARLSQTGTIDPSLGTYTYVEDFTELLAWVDARLEEGVKRVPLTCDLETVGLDPYDPDKWIVSISFTPEAGTSRMRRFTGRDDQPSSLLQGQIHLLLNWNRVAIRGANFKFDMNWLVQKWGIACTNFTMDTTLVGSLLDENRSNSLNTHAKVYTAIGGYDDSFNRKYDKSRMDLVPKEDLLIYAGGDTDACYRVAEAEIALLKKDQKLHRFYTRLLHPASIAFQQMEQNGILIDVEYFEKLQQQLEHKMSALSDEAFAMLPKRLQRKWAYDFSLTKGAVILSMLFSKTGLGLKPLMKTEKTGAPATSEDHLRMFSDHPVAGPWLNLLFAYKAAQKTNSTYVVGFLKHLRADGRLHPTAILHKGDYGGGGKDSGTVTGRLAFKDPAQQTLPKHTEWAPILRRGYPAPPGYVVVQWDYSQGELRITACIANEPNMIAAYKAGIDMHLKTGAELNGYTLEEALELKAAGGPLIKVIRQGGKAGNFGLIYGMGGDGYQEYAQTTYGVTLTRDEAHEQREAFFQLYPGLVKWHRVYKSRAAKQGFIRSPLGRIRHLPLINSPRNDVRSKAERQAINSPVQSALSDLSQWALARFHQKHGNPESCRFFSMTHDSLAAYVRIEEVGVWVPEVRNLMENLPIYETFGWDPQLKFLVDAEMGPTMGDLKEIEWDDDRMILTPAHTCAAA